ncbi:MAG: FHA domain-containing protein [Chloroflexi bacterium]|nr:FHA domain-containing protein [Chloroflexota bacterium]
MEQIRLTWTLDGNSHTYTITPEREIKIGRRLECDVVLPDPSVSRQHAAIYSDDGKFHLRNLSQVNPVNITIKGEDSVLDYNQTTVIEPGNAFHIGPIKIEVIAVETAS